MQVGRRKDDSGHRLQSSGTRPLQVRPAGSLRTGTGRGRTSPVESRSAGLSSGDGPNELGDVTGDQRRSSGVLDSWVAQRQRPPAPDTGVTRALAVSIVGHVGG